MIMKDWKKALPYVLFTALTNVWYLPFMLWLEGLKMNYQPQITLLRLYEQKYNWVFEQKYDIFFFLNSFEIKKIGSEARLRVQ